MGNWGALDKRWTCWTEVWTSLLVHVPMQWDPYIGGPFVSDAHVRRTLPAIRKNKRKAPFLPRATDPEHAGVSVCVWCVGVCGVLVCWSVGLLVCWCVGVWTAQCSPQITSMKPRCDR